MLENPQDLTRQPHFLESIEKRKEETLKGLVVLSAVFPRENVKTETLAAYVDALSDIPSDELVAAMREIVLVSRFFPSISDIRRRVAEKRLGLPSIEEAFEQAFNSLDGLGQPTSYAVSRALAAVGGEREYTNGSFWRKAFREMYKDICEKMVDKEMIGDE